MSDRAISISEAVERLRCCDSTLEYIDLINKDHTDADVAELVDCLMVHPNIVTRIYLHSNSLTDETGVKLAQYLAVSSTIEYLGLAYNNQFSSVTHLAMAAALRSNSSLRELHLHNTHVMEQNCINRIDAAFIDALILNPTRPIYSGWMLYSWRRQDFDRLKAEANRLGHPNMQALLVLADYSL